MVQPDDHRTYGMFIDGRWVEAAEGVRHTRISPAHGVAVSDFPAAGGIDVDRAVQAARRAFDAGPWPGMGGADRARVLRRVADAIRGRQAELARREALESGKPIRQARDEVATAADLWEYAAGLARGLHGDSYANLGPSVLGLVLREPSGVVAAITPWNFPLLIISQKLPFALAAGCTVVVKPSELTPGTTLELAAMLHECGAPAGVVNVITGTGPEAGSPLVAHPLIDVVTFTGSTRVGKAISAAASATLKRVSLELGGKNPQIVFADADLDAALDAVVFGVCFNQGECCNAGSRLLVQKEIARPFIQRVVERARSVVVGDPLDETVQIGAIVNDAQYHKILGYIAAGRAEGAHLALGGKPVTGGPGLFIEPTVYDGVRPEMSIAREEIFGPVLAALEFRTVDEAVAIANDTLYGLSAGIWTSNIDAALVAARGIRAGTVWVNTFMDGYPELPFGGYKESGVGRELGRFSLDEFTELKTVQLHSGPRTAWVTPRR